MSKRKNLFLLFTLFLFTGLSFNSYAGPVCGDGNPEAPEECDDGNAVDTDFCRNDCTLPLCGDGIVNGNDECDDGNVTNGDGCDSLCMIETTTTTTTTTGATTSTTGATTSTTGATTSTTGATTSTTGATTSTTGATTSTTGATTSTTAPATTTTTMGGGGTTTTTTATTSTTAAATTTTTQVPGEPSVDVPLDSSDGGTVTITTEAGETISDVSTGTATGGPSGINFPFGTISYTTSSPVGGSVTMTFEFSTDLPDNLVIYKVDNNGVYTELPGSIWTKTGARTVEVTVTDGDGLTDQDGVENGSIEDPLAVGGGQGDRFDFGGGGCSISKAPSAGMDPIWLFLLLAPGLGILRRRVAGASGAKSI